MEEPIFFFGSSISFGLYYYFASIYINNQIGEMFFTKKIDLVWTELNKDGNNARRWLFSRILWLLGQFDRERRTKSMINGKYFRALRRLLTG